MDSLDMVEFIMELEREFAVDLPDEQAATLSRATLGDVWRLTVQHTTGVEPPAGPPPPADPTWRRLVRLVSRLTGTPPDDVRWDAPWFNGGSPGSPRAGDG